MEQSFESALLRNLIIKTKILLGFGLFYLIVTLLTIYKLEVTKSFVNVNVLLLFLIPIFIVIIMIAETGILKYLQSMLKKGGKYKKRFIYPVSFFEISIPTMIMVFIINVVAHNEQGATMNRILNGVQPMVYIVLIILSAFHLDFKFSSFLGLFACVQYLSITLFYIDLESNYLINLVPITKAFYFLFFGICAGYAGLRIKKSTLIALASKNILINELDSKVKERTIELQKQKELVEEKNKEITESIHYAERIQSAILPPISTIQNYLDTFIFYKPKDIVAGDFYWFHTEGDIVYFVAADCTGHGVPGAMVSMISSSALTKSVRELKITDPNKILDKTREIVVETFEEGEEEVQDGMDLCFCKLNLKTNELIFAGSYNPLYHIYKKTGNEDENILINEDYACREYKSDRQPIGKTSDPKPFSQQEIQLKKGETIYIISDGFPDQFGGPKLKKFRYKRLQELLMSIQHLPMQEQHIHLEKTFADWKGNEEQTDDVIVMGVRI